jgi:hypothetical protein
MKINIDEQELKNKIEEGLDNAALAAFFKCSKRTINYRKTKYGLSQNLTMLSSEKEKIKELYSINKSIKEISNILNRSENTIRNFLVKSELHVINTDKKISKDKQCPYCTYVNSSWKSIRAHTSNCSLSTHDYFISLTYGPILLSSLENENYLNIKKMFPNISSAELSSLSTLLRKRGYSTKVEWDTLSAKNAIVLWVQQYNKIPSSRDTYNNTNLPSDSWVKRNFKTWNSFITYCGYTPSNNQYGTNLLYKDNTMLRSNFEYYFVDNYLYGKYNYEYEKSYPGNTNRVCDYYLYDYDLYIELAGGLRPEVIKEKINFCKDNGLKLLVLYPKQIYNKNFSLDFILGGYYKR